MPAPNLPARCFVDTNVWLYALVAGQDTLKHTRAQEIVQRTGIVISTQIINETCVNLLKKTGLAESQIQQLIVAFYTKYEVIATEQAVLLRASQLREQYSLSYWDGLVVASALEAGCTVLYSEDMQAGLVVMGQLTIINPFHSAA
jgi:predicted nucleic acid-binding protein